MGDAALPLTREQIDEYERRGYAYADWPLFYTQARAALDLADECARLRAENERLRVLTGEPPCA